MKSNGSEKMSDVAQCSMLVAFLLNRNYLLKWINSVRGWPLVDEAVTAPLELSHDLPSFSKKPMMKPDSHVVQFKALSSGS